ncbi:MAG TPA: hypothetical protein VFZ67_05080 [Nitrososphaera sp.]|jgi:hypothetical protein
MRRPLSVVQTLLCYEITKIDHIPPQLSVEDVEAEEVVEVMNLHRALSDSLTMA